MDDMLRRENEYFKANELMTKEKLVYVFKYGQTIKTLNVQL